MKTASIQEIKQELQHAPSKTLVEYCLRLARFKKENKELLTYLLFDAHNESAFIESVKSEMNELFASMNRSNLYFAKKSIRKTLRVANRAIRYAGSVSAGVEVLLHFCRLIRDSGLEYERSTALLNLYRSQQKKIRRLMDELHEDLRYDYEKELRCMDKE